MTVVIQYEVDARTAEEYFAQVGYRARDMSSPFSRTRTLIRSILIEQFDTEGELFPSDGYPAWAPNSPNTHKADWRVGRDTGEMYRAAVEGVHSGGDWVESVIRRYSDDGYDIAEIFASGDNGKPNTPGRPIWETTDAFKEEVNLIFWRWAAELKSHNARRRGSPFNISSLIMEPSFVNNFLA